METNLASIKNLPTTGRYEIFIRSENSVGISENSSMLTISTEMGSGLENRIPSLLNISKEENKLSWQPPVNQEQLIGL